LAYQVELTMLELYLHALAACLVILGQVDISPVSITLSALTEAFLGHNDGYNALEFFIPEVSNVLMQTHANQGLEAGD
jgi:hypothetical protein